LIFVIYSLDAVVRGRTEKALNGGEARVVREIGSITERRQAELLSSIQHICYASRLRSANKFPSVAHVEVRILSSSGWVQAGVIQMRIGPNSVAQLRFERQRGATRSTCPQWLTNLFFRERPQFQYVSAALADAKRHSCRNMNAT
jgi:hypothetical protein